MKYFYLVRHGEKQKTQGDPPLSLTGRQQAQRTAKHLSKIPVKAVFSSPLRRTKETAEEIGKTFGIPVSVTPLLRERVNWGDDQDQSLEDFLSMWKQATSNRNWQPPVGDSSVQSGQRLASLINSLSKHPAEHIVFVTHGGIITDLLRNLFEDAYLDTHLPNFSSTIDDCIKECSITILEYDEMNSGFTLASVGMTSHLDDF